MIKVTMLTFKITTSYFWVVMFLALPPVGSVSLGSFVLLEHLVMLLTSAFAIICKRRNLLNNAICGIGFEKPFLDLSTIL